MSTQHDLTRIFSKLNDYDEELVVRWCRQCGAVVIDIDLDDRTMPGAIAHMRVPEKMKQSHCEFSPQ